MILFCGQIMYSDKRCRQIKRQSHSHRVYIINTASTAASWNFAWAGFSLRKIFYKHQASIYQKVTLQAQDTGYQVQNTRYERE